MTGKEDRTDTTRRALRDQLLHLAEEIDAFASQLDAVPLEVLSTRPLEDELSLKEVYALIAAFDHYVYFPAVHGLELGEAVELSTWSEASLLEEENWDEMEMDVLLRRASSGRVDLVAALAELPDWNLSVRSAGESGNVYDLAYAIIRHDTELLRTAATRLHELGRLRK